jgi:hypothetical protein
MADSVEIVLGANTSKAIAGLQSFASASKLAIGVAIGALEELVRTSIDFADQMGKAAQKAGAAVETFSGLAYAAKLSNVSVEELTKHYKELSKTIVNDSDALKNLGIDWFNQDGTLRASSEVLLDIADRFERMPDGINKTVLATRLFGKAGGELIPLLNQGSKAIRAQQQEARDLGVVIDLNLSKSAEDFNDNMTKLGQAIRGFGLDIAREILPTLNALTSKLLEATKAFRKWKEEQASNPGSISAILGSGVQLVAAGAKSIGVLSGLLGGQSWDEIKSRIDDIKKESRGVIDQLLHPNPEADGTPNAPGGDKSDEQIARLSEEERIRHQIYITEQLLADQSKFSGLTEEQRNKTELGYLQSKLQLLGKLVAEIESHPVKGGVGVLSGPEGEEQAREISEQAKAYNEKLLPAMREQARISDRIAELNDQNSFTGRLARQLGAAAGAAFDLSARLAETFGSAVMTGIDALSAGITGLIDGTRKWGEVMQQMGSQILGMFVQLIVRAVALYAIISLLNLVSPGLGSAIGKFAGISGGKASGGPIGPGLYAVGEQGTEYVVNNPTLARFGTGFFDRLNAGAAPAAASGGGGTTVHIALLNEQHQYHQWLQSTDGEKAVVDIVSRNIHRFRS